MLKLGYKASAEQFAPRQLLEFAVHAEAVGFDSIMVSDHFQPWRHTGGHAPFSFAWLGGARRAHDARDHRHERGDARPSATTRRSSRRRSATLGALYPGRVLLGVGTGESLNEVPATGMPWPPFKERLGRLREAIELMRRLAREERVTFEGEYYRTERATIYDRPDDAGADLRRRLRPDRGQARRPARRRLHLHQRQGEGALHRDLAAGGRRGAGAGRARPRTASSA